MIAKTSIGMLPFRWLFIFAVLSVFIGSFSALALLGFSMGDERAGLISRLHPALYLALPFLTILFVESLSNPRARRRSVSQLNLLQLSMVERLHKSFVVYLGTVLVAIAAASAGITHGSLANTVTTFLTPALLVFGIAECKPSVLRRLAVFIAWIMLANSLLGISEKLLDFRLFRYAIGTMEQTKDSRPTAWFSHPLNNALLTGLILISLIYTRQARSLGAIRILMIAVHSYALVCFGGRTAVVAILVVISFDYIKALYILIATGKGASSTLTRSAGILGGICAVAITIQLGYLDSLIERFIDDGGSAAVRWNAIDAIRDLDVRSVLFGWDKDMIESTLYSYDLFTIEFSWLYLVLMHGVIVTTLLGYGLMRLFINLIKTHDKPVGYMIAFFLIVTFGYTSIASATLVISELIVMIMVLLPPKHRVLKA